MNLVFPKIFIAKHAQLHLSGRSISQSSVTSGENINKSVTSQVVLAYTCLHRDMAERAVSDENKVLSDVSEDEISLELSCGSSSFDDDVKLTIVMLQHRSNSSLMPVAQLWSLTRKQIPITVPLDFKILIGNNFNTYKYSFLIYFTLNYDILINIFSSFIRDIHMYMLYVSLFLLIIYIYL